MTILVTQNILVLLFTYLKYLTTHVVRKATVQQNNFKNRLFY